jgi:ABC-type Fe3+/spermidine/putrescine transport system ATPase subunit
MNAGRVEQVGSPQAIYQQPQTRFVADFIGLAGFVPGEVLRVSGSEVAVRLVDGSEVVARQSDVMVGQSVELVLRPEMLGLCRPGAQPSGLNSVLATVTDVVYLGALLHYFVRLPDGTRLVVAQPPTRPEGAPAVNEPCVVTWPGEVGRLLPAAPAAALSAPPDAAAKV